MAIELSSSLIIIFASIGGTLFILFIFALLYIFCFSKNAYKKQLKDLKRQLNKLNGQLSGQISSQIHRLEIIGRTNVAYNQYYEQYRKEYNEIKENNSLFLESLLQKISVFIETGKYKNVKQALLEAKTGMKNYSNAVEQIKNKLEILTKQEEDNREEINRIKEKFRVFKTNYYSKTDELDVVCESFNKYFEKIESTFNKFDEYLDTADYASIREKLPVISKVIDSLQSSLVLLPSLCSTIYKIIPEKIEGISKFYHSLEDNGIPLFHLNFLKTCSEWNNDLNCLKSKISNLQTQGVKEECDYIQNEISKFKSKLDIEISAKNDFVQREQVIYKGVLDLEKYFLRICALLPEVKKIYIIDQVQSQKTEQLKANIDQLQESKRKLEGFVHSGTKQPYSILEEHLNNLENNYRIAKNGVTDFKVYIDSLKEIAQQAYEMIFTYYNKTKEIENYFSIIDVPAFYEQYANNIETIYNYIDELDTLIKTKPIDIAKIKTQVETLKAYSNTVFDEIEQKYNEAILASSAIVYANRDRIHQNDVHQELSHLESLFFQGEFAQVYQDANNIYQKHHVGENNRENK